MALTATIPPQDDSNINAIWNIESGNQHFDASGKPKVGAAGEVGVSQILRSTGQNPGFGVRPLQDDSEEENRRFGRDYFNAMLGRYSDPVMAAAAYNAGPGRLDRAISKASETGQSYRDFLPASTQNYITQFEAMVMKNPQQLAVKPVDPLAFDTANRTMSFRQGANLLNSDQHSPEEMIAIATDTSLPSEVRNAATARLKVLQKVDQDAASISNLAESITNAKTPQERLNASKNINDVFAQNKDPKWGRAFLAFLGGNLREVYYSLTGGESQWAPYTTPDGKNYMIEYNGFGQPIGATDDKGPVDYASIVGGVPSANKQLGKRDYTTLGKDLIVQTPTGFEYVTQVKDNLNDQIRYRITSGPNSGKLIDQKQILQQTPTTGIKTGIVSYRDKNGVERSLEVSKIGGVIVAPGPNGNPVLASDYVASMGGRDMRERSINWKPSLEIGAGDIPNAVSYSQTLQTPSFAFKTEGEKKAFQGVSRALQAEAEMTVLENQLGTDKITEAMNAIITYTNKNPGEKVTEAQLLAFAKNLSDPKVKDYYSAVIRYIYGILRPESGAAINAGELVGYASAFALNPGDKGVNLEQRRNARRSELLNLSQTTGPAAPYIAGVLDGTYPVPKGQTATLAKNPEGKPLPPATKEPARPTVKNIRRVE